MEANHQENNYSKKSLDTIPKHNVFKTPEDYFQKLPLQIQSKLEKKKSSWVILFDYIFAYKYALRIAIVFIAIGASVMIIWYNSSIKETQLAARKAEKKPLKQLLDFSHHDSTVASEFPSRQIDTSRKKISDLVALSNAPTTLNNKQFNSIDSSRVSTTNTPIDLEKLLSESSKEEVLAYLEEEYSVDYEWEEVSNKY